MTSKKIIPQLGLAQFLDDLFSISQKSRDSGNSSNSNSNIFDDSQQIDQILQNYKQQQQPKSPKQEIIPKIHKNQEIISNQKQQYQSPQKLKSDYFSNLSTTGTLSKGKQYQIENEQQYKKMTTKSNVNGISSPNNSSNSECIIKIPEKFNNALSNQRNQQSNSPQQIKQKEQLQDNYGRVSQSIAKQLQFQDEYEDIAQQNENDNQYEIGFKTAKGKKIEIDQGKVKSFEALFEEQQQQEQQQLGEDEDEEFEKIFIKLKNVKLQKKRGEKKNVFGANSSKFKVQNKQSLERAYDLFGNQQNTGNTNKELLMSSRSKNIKKVPKIKNEISGESQNYIENSEKNQMVNINNDIQKINFSFGDIDQVQTPFSTEQKCIVESTPTFGIFSQQYQQQQSQKRDNSNNNMCISQVYNYEPTQFNSNNFTGLVTGNGRQLQINKDTYNKVKMIFEEDIDNSQKQQLNEYEQQKDTLQKIETKIQKESLDKAWQLFSGQSQEDQQQQMECGDIQEEFPSLKTASGKSIKATSENLKRTRAIFSDENEEEQQQCDIQEIKPEIILQQQQSGKTSCSTDKLLEDNDLADMINNFVNKKQQFSQEKIKGNLQNSQEKNILRNNKIPFKNEIIMHSNKRIKVSNDNQQKKSIAKRGFLFVNESPKSPEKSPKNSIICKFTNFIEIFKENKKIHEIYENGMKPIKFDSFLNYLSTISLNTLLNCTPVYLNDAPSYKFVCACANLLNFSQGSQQFENQGLTSKINCFCQGQLLVGPEEILQYLLQKKLDPKLCTLDWIQNHYRFIVWKLSSYETKLNLNIIKKKLTQENMLKELEYRYYTEFIAIRRPILKKILEKDDLINCHMVLVIGNIQYIKQTSCIIELTDGWYSVYTEVDISCCLNSKNKYLLQSTSLIGDLVITNKIYTGLKVHVIVEKNPKSQEFIEFDYNSFSRAQWNNKLGKQSSSVLIKNIKSLRPNGGFVSFIQVVIVKIYQLIQVQTAESPQTKPVKKQYNGQQDDNSEEDAKQDQQTEGNKIEYTFRIRVIDALYLEDPSQNLEQYPTTEIVIQTKNARILQKTLKLGQVYQIKNLRTNFKSKDYAQRYNLHLKQNVEKLLILYTTPQTQIVEITANYIQDQLIIQNLVNLQYYTLEQLENDNQFLRAFILKKLYNFNHEIDVAVYLEKIINENTFVGFTSNHNEIIIEIHDKEFFDMEAIRQHINSTVCCLNLRITSIKINPKNTKIKKYTFSTTTTQGTQFLKNPSTTPQLIDSYDKVLTNFINSKPNSK